MAPGAGSQRTTWISPNRANRGAVSKGLLSDVSPSNSVHGDDPVWAGFGIVENTILELITSVVKRINQAQNNAFRHVAELEYS